MLRLWRSLVCGVCSRVDCLCVSWWSVLSPELSGVSMMLLKSWLDCKYFMFYCDTYPLIDMPYSSRRLNQRSLSCPGQLLVELLQHLQLLESSWRAEAGFYTWFLTTFFGAELDDDEIAHPFKSRWLFSGMLRCNPGN
jgi:hypothetical protein